jgi:hypothetical protein
LRRICRPHLAALRPLQKKMSHAASIRAALGRKMPNSAHVAGFRGAEAGRYGRRNLVMKQCIDRNLALRADTSLESRASAGAPAMLEKTQPPRPIPSPGTRLAAVEGR